VKSPKLIDGHRIKIAFHSLNSAGYSEPSRQTTDSNCLEDRSDTAALANLSVSLGVSMALGFNSVELAKSPTRGTAETKTELREMLADAVRNYATAYRPADSVFSGELKNSGTSSSSGPPPGGSILGSENVVGLAFQTCPFQRLRIIRTAENHFLAPD
jgi:hypothetical protein